jgi:presqualene diphosphate synthase
MITLERFIAGSDLVHRRDLGPTTSPTEDAAITQRIRNANPSFFWPTLLLPAPRRNAIQALYFFSRELRGIADGNALPTLKLAQLADWRAQIELLYAGRPQHFVTRALSDAVDRFDLRCVDFLAIIDGMEREARTNIRAPSLEQLYLYCKQRSVVVMRIALLPAGTTSTCRASCCRRKASFATMPSYVLAQPALPQVCDALAERAADWFADAEDALEGRSRWRMGAATAILFGYRRLLRALLVRGWKRLDEPVRLPAWCRPALAIGHGLIALKQRQFSRDMSADWRPS